MSNDTTDTPILERFFNCVNSGIEWSTAQIKSACPPRKKKQITPEKEIQSEDVELSKPDICDLPHCPKKSYIPPSRVCPTKEPCCFIKMQDPCAPCCCEPEVKLSPCPPKCLPQPPRTPTCGCDLCKKKNASGKCCDRNKTFHGITADSRYSEKA